MKLPTLLVAAVFWSSAAISQSTAEFDTKTFEYQLEQQLGAKAEGIRVSPEFAAAVSDDIRTAIDAMAAATQYIAQSLCSEPARPTRITLHLTAGFKLVFEAQTGSSVEWDLDTVCDRLDR